MCRVVALVSQEKKRSFVEMDKRPELEHIWPHMCEACFWAICFHDAGVMEKSLWLFLAFLQHLLRTCVKKTALFCVALMSAVYGGLVAMCLATSQNAN